jgi:hypothetical protein
MMNDRAGRLAARFQGEASAAASSTDETGERPETKRPRWDQEHQRFTVWLPIELVAKVKDGRQSPWRESSYGRHPSPGRELERLISNGRVVL